MHGIHQRQQIPISGNRLCNVGAVPFLQNLLANSPQEFAPKIEAIIDVLHNIHPLPPFDPSNTMSHTDRGNVTKIGARAPTVEISKQILKQAQLLGDVEDNLSARKLNDQYCTQHTV